MSSESSGSLSDTGENLASSSSREISEIFIVNLRQWIFSHDLYCIGYSIESSLIKFDDKTNSKYSLCSSDNCRTNRCFASHLSNCDTILPPNGDFDRTLSRTFSFLLEFLGVVVRMAVVVRDFVPADQDWLNRSASARTAVTPGGFRAVTADCCGLEWTPVTLGPFLTVLVWLTFRRTLAGRACNLLRGLTLNYSIDTV